MRFSLIKGHLRKKDRKKKRKKKKKALRHGGAVGDLSVEFLGAACSQRIYSPDQSRRINLLLLLVCFHQETEGKLLCFYIFCPSIYMFLAWFLINACLLEWIPSSLCPILVWIRRKHDILARFRSTIGLCWVLASWEISLTAMLRVVDPYLPWLLLFHFSVSLCSQLQNLV